MTGTIPRPVAPARIDPRIRERRNAVARDRGRRRLRVLLAAAAVVSVLVVIDLGLHSSLLSVSRIEVQGAGQEPVAAVTQAARLAEHQPLFGLDAAAVAARVEALPWIATARVERHWPHSIAVVVTERVPVAQLAEPAGRWALVDGSGRILAVTGARRPGLVQLSVRDPAGAPGTRLRPADTPALAVAAALPALPAPRLAQVTAVVPQGGGAVTLSLVGGVAVVLGPPTELAAKLAALTTVLSQVDMSGVRTIDLRVPGQPALTRA